ncbi:hypothetical protein V2H45_16325 [Tumidithrix elongata RA019]|uniref:Uncharacterized protein n=1 Tax=Tumidithrix elongata BACA0141 TaxID=2716417 RepID=A0AAW9PZ58_9CYAN|nr:hypothetical protein [Tumidithrix elongata RA019]
MQGPLYKSARLTAKKVYQEKDLITRLQLLEEQQQHEYLDSRVEEIAKIKAELTEIEAIQSLRDSVLEIRYGSPISNLVQSGIGLILGWFLVRISVDAQSFLSYIPIAATFLIIITLGIILYIIRLNFRILYGMAELVVGCLTALRYLLPELNVDLPDQIFYLQFLGGLYIIVRGLDNVTKGLEAKDETTFWRILINRVKEFFHSISSDEINISD